MTALQMAIMFGLIFLAKIAWIVWARWRYRVGFEDDADVSGWGTPSRSEPETASQGVAVPTACEPEYPDSG
jgi:hypothetical protein